MLGCRGQALGVQGWLKLRRVRRVPQRRELQPWQPRDVGATWARASPQSSRGRAVTRRLFSASRKTVVHSQGMIVNETWCPTDFACLSAGSIPAQRRAKIPTGSSNCTLAPVALQRRKYPTKRSDRHPRLSLSFCFLVRSRTSYRRPIHQRCLGRLAASDHLHLAHDLPLWAPWHPLARHINSQRYR